MINWGPRFNYSRIYDYNGVLTDEDINLNVQAQFTRNMNINASVTGGMERYGGIDFDRRRFSLGGGVNTSRRFSFGGFMNIGKQIRYIEAPYLGNGLNGALFITLRPVSRLQSQIEINTSRFVDPRIDREVFNVKILRALTTYQFTDRLVMRNITEVNSFDGTLALNLLGTYRVNSGTVFFAGYDDRYRHADKFDSLTYPALVFPGRGLPANKPRVFREAPIPVQILITEGTEDAVQHGDTKPRRTHGENTCDEWPRARADR